MVSEGCRAGLRQGLIQPWAPVQQRNRGTKGLYAGLFMFQTRSGARYRACEHLPRYNGAPDDTGPDCSGARNGKGMETAGKLYELSTFVLSMFMFTLT